MMLSGCAASVSPIPLDRPYFSVEPEKAKTFQSLAARQEHLASRCIKTNSCDHVYFTRALLGLYERREIAEKYFQKVVAVAPKGQLAASSRVWLHLLREEVAPGQRSWLVAVMGAPAFADANTSLAQTANRLVRDLLDREIIIQQLRASKVSRKIQRLQRELADRDQKIESLRSKKDRSKNSAEETTVRGLQKQIADRDRKIEELSTQLEALKRIDQEMREKVRPIRPPSMVVPIPSPDTMP